MGLTLLGLCYLAVTLVTSSWRRRRAGRSGWPARRSRWGTSSEGSAPQAVVFLQVMLSDTLRQPDWVDGLSPFRHLSVERFDVLPALGTLALSAALVVLAVWGFRRRDVAAG